MKHLLFVALGGATGAVLRYTVANVVALFWHGRLPLATLGVNIVGSFAIGLLYVLIAERGIIHPDWRSVAMVGLLGALTTFSTFSLETVLMLERGDVLAAFGYVLGSVLTCIGAAWCAIALARVLWPA